MLFAVKPLPVPASLVFCLTQGGRGAGRLFQYCTPEYINLWSREVISATEFIYLFRWFNYSLRKVVRVYVVESFGLKPGQLCPMGVCQNRS